MYTIAIVNEKGGTGKTTTAVNLSAALGEMGHKVLLVDLDGQAASSRWLGVEDDTSFADALYAGKGLSPLIDVIPNVSLAPASGKLDAVAHDLRPTQGGQLRKLLNEAGNGFEYVIIDCPPSLGNRLIGNALLAASHAIVPVETSILALDGLKILLTTLDDVREGFDHEVALAGVLACRFDSRTRLSRLVLDELNRALPGKVFTTVIRENVRMRECPASGQSILAYASESHAAEDYRALAKELVSSGVLSARPAGAETADQAAMLAGEDGVKIGDMLRQVVRGISKDAGPGTEVPASLIESLAEAQRRLLAETGERIEEKSGAVAQSTVQSITTPPAAAPEGQAPSVNAADEMNQAEPATPAWTGDTSAKMDITAILDQPADLPPAPHAVEQHQPPASVGGGENPPANPVAATVERTAEVTPAQTPAPASINAAGKPSVFITKDLQVDPAKAQEDSVEVSPQTWLNMVTGVDHAADRANGESKREEWITLPAVPSVAAEAGGAATTGQPQEAAEVPLAAAPKPAEPIQPIAPDAWDLGETPTEEIKAECPNLKRYVEKMKWDIEAQRKLPTPDAKRGILRRFFAGHKS